MTLEELLQKHKIHYIDKHRTVIINCISGLHEDHNPSLSILKETGSGKCFSCGFTVNLFSKYGESISTPLTLEVERLKGKLRELASDDYGVDIYSLPGFNYRTLKTKGIKPPTLKKFECFTTTSEALKDRVCFPVKNSIGKTISIVGRAIEQDHPIRYKFYPSGIQPPLYPQVKDSYMVLVEGIFDMLKLHQGGIPQAVCQFGTTALYKKAEELTLSYKIAGVRTVFLLLDNDLAGRSASKELTPILGTLGFNVIDLTPKVLEPTCDPGGMADDEIDNLKDLINEHISNR